MQTHRPRRKKTPKIIEYIRDNIHNEYQDDDEIDNINNFQTDTDNNDEFENNENIINDNTTIKKKSNNIPAAYPTKKIKCKCPSCKEIYYTQLFVYDHKPDQVFHKYCNKCKLRLEDLRSNGMDYEGKSKIISGERHKRSDE